MFSIVSLKRPSLAMTTNSLRDLAVGHNMAPQPDGIVPSVAGRS